MTNTGRDWTHGMERFTENPRRSDITMKKHRSSRSIAVLLAACIAVAVGGVASAVPTPAHLHFGQAVSVGDGTARAYATVDANGAPTAVGIRFSPAALDGLPDADEMYMLHLPVQASDTVFDHVMLNWNPRGHDPTVLFGKPHFDMHFYMTDMAAIEAIDPTAPDYAARAERLPDPKYMPGDYVTPPGMLASQLAVPFMGVHWLDITEKMVPGVYDFTETFVNGSWDGDYTFMEPMITREWLLTRPTIREQIKLPAAYQHSAWYPTVYSVGFDEQAQEYDIALGGMVPRQAS